MAVHQEMGLTCMVFGVFLEGMCHITIGPETLAALQIGGRQVGVEQVISIERPITQAMV